MGEDSLGGNWGMVLMRINELRKFMSLIDPAGRGPNRRNDSLGVIDHPVVFVPWPSFESMLANQGGFWIGATLILLIYFCLRSWWGKLCVLIVILLVLICLCFVTFLILFP